MQKLSVETARLIYHVRGAAMQWLLLRALDVSPPGGSRGDLAATIQGFLGRECLRMSAYEDRHSAHRAGR